MKIGQMKNGSCLLASTHNDNMFWPLSNKICNTYCLFTTSTCKNIHRNTFLHSKVKNNLDHSAISRWTNSQQDVQVTLCVSTYISKDRRFNDI